jgi:tetratricopeptide (TPR) repeat protein
MRTLRLVQRATTTAGLHQVDIAIEGDGPRPAATAQVRLDLPAAELERLRWYLEDYLEYPIDPAPKIAAQVEQGMVELGTGLFRSVFEASEESRRLWATFSGHLDDTRVEVVTDVAGATAIPWELLREPTADAPVALRAHAFVRGHPNPAERNGLQPAEDCLRVLLVICRPKRGVDVPFRSVGGQLVRLSPAARDALQLDMLRPPTFKRLAEVLGEAERRGQPYHVVHFDGHGTYSNLREFGLAVRPRGYLLFEDPKSHRNLLYVDGHRLGRLLAETGVPLLVLNACRSAHAELATTPEEAVVQTATSAEDPHGRVRAYGSLAQEVVETGVAGVVAMRYRVYVVTAAQFVADLYASLLAGQSLGAAVTHGRRQLAHQPYREIAFAPRPLQDWVVPLAYEATPLTLVEPPAGPRRPAITLDEAAAGRERASMIRQLPGGPSVGFYGRDETLLALDRAFDTHQVVLLHALAGSGKTSTAVEFARWYGHTGGFQGPTLFTSFEQHLPLGRVLDQFDGYFDAELARQGKDWLAMSEMERRDAALALLRQVPLLWIWDNVEPVAGFPPGTQSAWSAAEQQELADFLHEVQTTKAKVLLVSRRDERTWLRGLPVGRVRLPPMPLVDRVQLARAIANRHHRQLTDVDDWRPLLDYTQGNPLTVNVLVGQALREGMQTGEEVEDFVARLRAGEASLADDERQGRSRSLGASLSYGFAHAFSEAERAQLALLHLFQGFVTVDALCWMGNPNVAGEAAVAAVDGLTRQAGIALLDRAAEIGLLTAFEGGFYMIHPALPWYFTELFTTVHGPTTSPAAVAATHAYTAAIAQLGNNYHRQFNEGRQEVIHGLRAEEANLLQARRLARAHGWWDQVMGAMQGLGALYEHTGRREEWARLVYELIPDLVDPATDRPLPGREEQWSAFTGYRVRLARRQRDWAAAERLQRVDVAWDRERAAPALAIPPENLDAEQRNQIRTLAASLGELGEVLRLQKHAGCVEAYAEALELARRIGDRQLGATAAYDLGNAYKDLPGLRDLDVAGRWAQASLDLHDEADRLSLARSRDLLGAVHYERFLEARAAGRPAAEQAVHLTAAANAYHHAIVLFPADAVSDLAVTHNDLGRVYADAGQIDTAVGHWQQSIRYKETAGNRYGAATTRGNIALARLRQGQVGEALQWYQAALGDYETYGERAAADIKETREIIARIEQVLAEQAGRSARW